MFALGVQILVVEVPWVVECCVVFWGCVALGGFVNCGSGRCWWLRRCCEACAMLQADAGFSALANPALEA